MVTNKKIKLVGLLFIVLNLLITYFWVFNWKILDNTLGYILWVGDIIISIILSIVLKRSEIKVLYILLLITTIIVVLLLLAAGFIIFTVSSMG
ncbi:hypothetical protein CSC2_19070 [Clostridium zeae]|uniref:Uncharacterized protein n=1 Tax=Clostridium zeae TaxID=2759022 RepID=A0ABQ1E9B2_9CLOT|nr:hypothetical protein [Clostridium zeae]GFZ31381.1 hypothetical protein CSC2_19070 [Clostridium zeae]